MSCFEVGEIFFLLTLFILLLGLLLYMARKENSELESENIELEERNEKLKKELEMEEIKRMPIWTATDEEWAELIGGLMK